MVKLLISSNLSRIFRQWRESRHEVLSEMIKQWKSEQDGQIELPVFAYRYFLKLLHNKVGIGGVLSDVFNGAKIGVPIESIDGVKRDPGRVDIKGGGFHPYLKSGLFFETLKGIECSVGTMDLRNAV